MEETSYTKRRISDLAKRTYSSLSASSFAAVSQKIDNRPPIVIEVGKRLTRIGFAGEFTPREIFPTQYVDPLTIVKHNIFDEEYSEKEQHLMLIKFFKDIVFRKLLTTINERRLVLVESVLSPTKIRNAIAKAFFECPPLSPHSILFAPSHLLCTFPFNAKSCLIVDVASDETTLFPIAEGCMMLNSYESTCLCLSSVERNVETLLRKYGKVRKAIRDESGNQPLYDFTEENVNLMNKLGIIEDIVVRFCFVTTTERGKKIRRYVNDETTDIDTPPPNVELPFGTDILIVPGIVREAAAEILFIDGDCDNPSITQIILNAIRKAPVDLRKVFLSRLLIVGGVSRMKGFLSRLKAELLLRITDPRNEYNDCLSGLKDIGFYLFDSDINLELYCAWLGGSMFGIADVLEGRSITREDWIAQDSAKRSVPDWTNF